MYRISDEARALFKDNYRQVISIIFHGLDRTFELTEADIIQGGLTINRYCVSGSKIEIGSAIAGELSVKLDNRDDRFANELFEGAELEVRIGVKKWNAYKWERAQVQWIPCGFFTVDETPRKLSNITLTALDRMVRFDVPVNPEDISFPTTVGALLNECCDNCNVPLSTDATTLTNYNYTIPEYPGDDEITYRQLIQWIAEMTGTCAYIDWEGKLRLEWYTQTPTRITPADRYKSDMYEQDITITGVQICDNEDNVYLAGTDDYAFNIENNLLIQSQYASIAIALYNKVGGFTYRPYSCTCKPMPHIYPLDVITYVDKNGVEHNSIITMTTFKVNTAMQIEGKGETNTKNGYAAANPLTKAEAIALKKLENRVTAKISNREQAALDMNALICNSLGLYQTITRESNGSSSFYYHNQPTLEESTIIYTFKANGFAWTDEWNGENTVWNYGITKDGNAVLNMVAAYKITADYIDATNLHVQAANIDGKITASQIEAFEIKVNAADIVGQLTAAQIDATNLHVQAANIDGNITANSLLVKDSSNHTLLSAGSNAVQIAGFTVQANAIKNTTPQTVDWDDGEGHTETYHYENGIKITNDSIDISKDQFSIILKDGMINIGTPMLRSGNYVYYPLMSFYMCGLDNYGNRIPNGTRYYVVARRNTIDSTMSSWQINITSTLNFETGGGGGGGTIVL